MHHLDNTTLLQQSIDRLRRSMRDDIELRQLERSAAQLDNLKRQSSCIALLAAAFEQYAARPCLGSRSLGQPYETQTYREVWQRVQTLAAGLEARQLLQPGDFVGLLGFASADWAIADLAALYCGGTSVPLQTTYSPSDLRHIIEETQLRLLICSAEQIAAVAGIVPQCPSVRGVVVIDGGSQAHVASLADRLAPSGCCVVSLADAMRGNPSVPAPAVPGRNGIPTDPLVTLMYTSGSTGAPKGAMFTDSLWRQELGIALAPIFPDIPTVTLNYLPLNHIMGRSCNVLHTYLRGGTVYFASSSTMETLFEDIRLARPTALALVPRVSGLLRAMRESSLGDRLTYIYTGGAPTPPTTVEFLQQAFHVPVFNYYGSTECGPVTFDQRVIDSMIASYELVDTPELGYRLSDKPAPRGELRIKSPRMIAGYYKNPEASRGLRDAEGFMRSGDIVEEPTPRQLYYVDRRNNVLKLSQGEFVAVTRLENLYTSSSADIEQIYLYGESTRNFILAVVVPSGAAKERATGDDLKALLRQSLLQVAREASFASYETPRDFIVELTPFDQSNGLLTESNKLARARLKAAYGPQLTALYDSLENQRADALLALRHSDVPIAEKVRRVMAHTLGLEALAAEHEASTFGQLGGDSLTAVQLCRLLHDVCGLDLQVSVVLNPSSSIALLLEHLAKPTSTARPSQAPANGILRAGDLRLGDFLPPTLLRPRGRPQSPASTVLLTGANGFLGRFLALEILERLPQAQLVCLVRGESDAQAAARMHAMWASPPELQKRAAAVASRLQVYASDIAEPQLGLSDERYTALCSTVDAVVHNAALVNHRLSYAQLYAPNVHGSIEMIRLVLQGRAKSLCFVSSAGLFTSLNQPTPVSENATAEALWPERNITEGYAAGYSTSKWVVEVLLGQLHAQCGVPVSIVRGGMMLPHRDYVGHMNLPDVYARLLVSLVHTGLAPKTFYVAGAAPHYDGTPVDWVARGIAIAACEPPPGPGWHIFHALNPSTHPSANLDDVARWVHAAGYPLEWVDDHAAWFEQFGTRLRALPVALQKRSLLPLLQAWKAPITGDQAAEASGFAALGDGPVPRLDAAQVEHDLAHLRHWELIGLPAQ